MKNIYINICKKQRTIVDKKENKPPLFLVYRTRQEIQREKAHERL